MSRRKRVGRKPSKIKKASLNTTIHPDVLNMFRDKCNSINKTMGEILELFMIEFVQDKVRLGIVEVNEDIEPKE